MDVEYVGKIHKTPFNISIIQEKVSAMHQKTDEYYYI